MTGSWKIPLLLFLGAMLSLICSQETRIEFPGGRLFTFSAKASEMLNPIPAQLLKAASIWCLEERAGLAVKPEHCAEMIVKSTMAQLIDARASHSNHPRTGQHGLTPTFFEIADTIFSPPFGTEQMGPLLHSLVRFHRPEHVVELGFGYTTPFLAQGLADNAVNVAHERHAENTQRQAQILQDRWFIENPKYETRRKLTVIDDQSQRRDSGEFGRAVDRVLNKLKLEDFVSIESSMNLARAHTLFKRDSLGLVWNDAQWDAEFLRRWWPLVKKDGGLLLLHNVIGNGELSRWCVASPRRVMHELFPGEKFEFITLLEPHKAYQGSVALLRRLDTTKAPDKYRFLWGRKEGVRQYSNMMDAFDRPPYGLTDRRGSSTQEQRKPEL